MHRSALRSPRALAAPISARRDRSKRGGIPRAFIKCEQSTNTKTTTTSTTIASSSSSSDIESHAASSTSTSSSSSSSSPPSTAAAALALSLALSLGSPCCLPPAALAAASSTPPSSVFFDIAIDNEPVGRLTVELLGSGSGGGASGDEASSSSAAADFLAPVGVARFAELAEDKDGVGYVRSKIDGIEKDRVIRSSGVASLAYRDGASSRVPGGDTVEILEKELDAQRRAAASGNPVAPKHDRAGVVSLIVRDANPPPIKTRLVAYNGKLVTVEEPRKGAPNGTAFVVTLAPAPELDATNLVVGRLKEGRELVERLSELPVSSNRSDSAFFKIAKATGDRRADVAAKFFYRPFSTVRIVNSGKV